MPLAYKPQSVTWKTAANRTSGGVVVGADRTLIADLTIAGQLTRKTPEWALREFGVEVQQPAIFLMDNNDHSGKVGDWVVYDGKNFAVHTIVHHDAEAITAHWVVLMDQVENAG